MAREAEIGFGFMEDPQPEANGVLVSNEKAEKPLWMKSELWKITSGFVAAVAAVLAMGGMMNKAGADIIADFDPANWQPVPTEMDVPGNSRCSVTPDNNYIRWRHVVSSSPVESYIREVEIVANSGGTISVIPPVNTITTDSSTLYGRSVETSLNNEFQQTSGGRLLKNGGMVIDGVGFWGLTDDHIDGGSIVMSVHMGRSRGPTVDTGDIVKMEEVYSGPPMPITTLDELRANVTSIPELSQDPPDPNEAYLQGTAVFSAERGYVTQKCVFGMASTCLPPLDTEAGTDDIYMFDYDPVAGTWLTSSMTKIASTNTENESGVCVLDTPNAECLFISQGSGLSAPLYYACSAKDDDSDGMTNWVDNCVNIPNSLQENVVHPGDLEGDACDDPDVDVIFDDADNCPDIWNPGQEDTNGNGIGNACEAPPPPDEGPEPAMDMTPESDMPRDGGSDMPTDEGVDVLPDEGPEPAMDMTPESDMPRDAGMERPVVDEGVDVQDETTPPPDQEIESTEMPIQPPDGCTCILAKKPEENSWNKISLFVLGLFAIRKRRKSSKE